MTIVGIEHAQLAMPAGREAFVMRVSTSLQSLSKDIFVSTSLIPSGIGSS